MIFDDYRTHLDIFSYIKQIITNGYQMNFPRENYQLFQSLMNVKNV